MARSFSESNVFLSHELYCKTTAILDVQGKHHTFYCQFSNLDSLDQVVLIVGLQKKKKKRSSFLRWELNTNTCDSVQEIFFLALNVHSDFQDDTSKQTEKGWRKLFSWISISSSFVHFKISKNISFKEVVCLKYVHRCVHIYKVNVLH